MTHPLRRLVTATLAVAALAAAPLAAVTVASPAVSSACAPGETGVTNGCAPFCLPGLVLDTQTGLCVREQALPPPPPPRNGVAPQSFSA
jgi:hypothetical protein